jgi:hypothetical protein
LKINNYLLVHTEEALFILQPNPQSFVSDVNNIYISTGDFLGIPPQEISQTDMGYAGMKTKLDSIDTPFGHIWTDQDRGQIFNFNTKIDELSSPNNGMSSWFKEELISYMDRSFYAKFGLPYPHNSTYNGLTGLGVNLMYDPRFKRLIISNDKSLFTGRALIDDRTKYGVTKFGGEHIHFGSDNFPNWDSVLEYLF